MAKYAGCLKHDVVAVAIELAAHDVHLDPASQHELGKVRHQPVLEQPLAQRGQGWTREVAGGDPI